jgi:hypothetical protein
MAIGNFNFNSFKAQILLQQMELYHTELTKQLYSLPKEKPDTFDELNRETFLLTKVYDDFLTTRDKSLLAHLSQPSLTGFQYLLDANHYTIQKMRTKFRSYHLLTTEQLHEKIQMFQQRFTTALNSFPRKRPSKLLPFIVKTLSSINCFNQLINDHEDSLSLLNDTPTSALLSQTLPIFYTLLAKVKSYGPYPNLVIPGELY